MNKTALVTGSSGLIGRYMTEELMHRGWDVRVCDIQRGPYSMSTEDARDVFRYTTHSYNLVVHAAYHVGGRVAIDGVNSNFAKNVELDGALFDFAARTRPDRVLYFSSSAVYPKDLQTRHASTSLREAAIDHRVCKLPDHTYGWAKLTGEKIVDEARKDGLKVTVVRPFSGYSHNQSDDYPFPSIVKRAIAGDYSVWGPQGQTRDWVHIDDVIASCLHFTDNELDGPFNICTGIPTEMGQLMKMVGEELHLLDPQKYVHADEIEVKYLVDKPTGVHYRVGNPDKSHKHYKPEISVRDGIRRALATIL